MEKAGQTQRDEAMWHGPCPADARMKSRSCVPATMFFLLLTAFVAGVVDLTEEHEWIKDTLMKYTPPSMKYVLKYSHRKTGNPEADIWPMVKT